MRAVADKAESGRLGTSLIDLANLYIQTALDIKDFPAIRFALLRDASFLAAQAAAFHLWTGVEPPGDVLREALSSALGSGDREVAVAGD